MDIQDALNNLEIAMRVTRAMLTPDGSRRVQSAIKKAWEACQKSQTMSAASKSAEEESSVWHELDHMMGEITLQAMEKRRAENASLGSLMEGMGPMAPRSETGTVIMDDSVAETAGGKGKGRMM